MPGSTVSSLLPPLAIHSTESLYQTEELTNPYQLIDCSIFIETMLYYSHCVVLPISHTHTLCLLLFLLCIADTIYDADD